MIPWEKPKSIDGPYTGKATDRKENAPAGMTRILPAAPAERGGERV
jgi:hypothetical protein